VVAVPADDSQIINGKALFLPVPLRPDMINGGLNLIRKQHATIFT
jgi:hypothetical protein